MKKRIISLMIIIVLCMQIIPVVNAEESIKISTEADFLNFMQRVNSGETKINAELLNDISLSEASKSKKLKTVGSKDLKYRGTFDGKNHTIKGILFTENGSALFGYIDAKGKITNLKLSGSITGEAVAAVTAENYGTIENVKNYITILGTNLTGGICVKNGGTINNCENMGGIYIMDEYSAGGICAYNYGTVTNCRNFAVVNGIEGTVVSKNTGGIAGYNMGKIENCTNVGEIFGGENLAGIAAYNNSEYLIKNCRNFGNITGYANNTGGIIAYGENEGVLENVYNYGKIVGSGSYTAGISADNAARVDNAENHGKILGVGYVAGISAKTQNEMHNVKNYAEIEGDTYVSGIASYVLNTEIRQCVNYGVILGTSHYVGGISASLEGGKIRECYNAAEVSGAIGGSGNFTGGIVARMTDAQVIDAGSISDVKGIDTLAGAIGYKTGIAKAIFEYDEYEPAILNDRNPEDSLCVYSHRDYNYDTEYKDKFETGEIAWLLNTYNWTLENKGTWSQGDKYPVLADEYNKPTKRIVCSLNGQSTVYYTKSDGCIEHNDITLNPEAVFKGEDGNIIDKNDILYGIRTEPGVANVADGEQLKAAIENVNINKIVLVNDVICDAKLEIKRDLKINGNGKVLNLINSYIDILSGTLTLDKISLKSTTNVINVKGGNLVIAEYIDISEAKSIIASSGSVDLGGGIIYNSQETKDVPTLIHKGSAELKGIEKYTKDGENRYFYNILENAGVAWEIVIPAAENGLAYELYPNYVDDIVYFFMPCNADISKVSYNIVDMNGNIVEQIKNVDFSKEDKKTVNVKMKTYTIKVMKSDLPTLHIYIDEEHGTIKEMNTSVDHSVKCYGDVRMDVTPEMTEKYGWKSFVSKENDSKKPGTMEIRGRGNYTWTTELHEKKPYQLKLEKKTDVLGMGKAKRWILLKNNHDIIKNKLGLEIAEEMGLEYTCKSEFVDVFMNGVFLGNYLLTEKVEVGENRVEISDIDDVVEDKGVDGVTDLTGGYLLEIDNEWNEALQMIYKDIRITIKSPEDLAEKATKDNKYSYIIDKVESIFEAVFGDGELSNGKSYLDYIDIESFATYFWHQEFLKNGDCGRGSTFFYKNRDSIDKKIYAGPVWDSDRILEGYYPEGWVINTIDIAGTESYTFYKQLSTRKDFVKYLIYYYENSNMKEVFAKSNEKIDKYKTYLANSAKMNSIRWGIDDLSIDWYKKLLIDRAEWIDKNYKTLWDYTDNNVAVNGYYDKGDIVLEFNNLDKEDVSAKSVIVQYDKNGKVIAVDIKPMEVSSEESKKEIRMKKREDCKSFATYLCRVNGAMRMYNDSGMKL